MPRLLVHGLIGIPIFVLVMYVFGPADGALFFLSSILVDVDHVAGYYFLTKDWTWNLKEEYEKVSEWWTETHAKDIGYVHWLFLHRVEPWILLAYFAPSPINVIGVGALSNLILDMLEWRGRVRSMTIATDFVRLIHSQS